MSRARLLAILALCAMAASTAAFPATTWLQARAEDPEKRSAAEGALAAFGSGASNTAFITRGGFIILNDLVPGSRDRLCINSPNLGTTCAEYRDLPLEPATGRRTLVVPVDEANAWRLAVSVDEDGTGGQLFGLVTDADGNPVAGADVSLEPPSGLPFTFDLDGTPFASSTTGTDGRFLILNEAPGELVAKAFVGSTLVGLAYGRGVTHESTGLLLRPPVTLSGLVTDGLTGTVIPAATVSWDFDPTLTTVSSGGGEYTLAVADGLDRTLRGSKTGYREARNFQPSAADDPATLSLRLLSDASYASVQAGFGLIQAPSLGMILGRVVDSTGVPIAGAGVSVDPVFGDVRYFDAGSNPNASLTATTSSGLFAVFNVPVGLVVLTALAPGGTIRRAVAPTIAGGVTQGDLRAFETQAVGGRIFDEQNGTTRVGGALVQVVEFPELAVLAGPDGSFILNGVPKNTLLSLRTAKSGFVDTYTFRRNTGPADERVQNLFLVSDLSVNALYLGHHVTFDQARGLIATSLRASTGNGISGLQGSSVPASGLVSYPGTKNGPSAATSSLGNMNVLSTNPGEFGVVIADPRSDFTAMDLAPVRPGSATVDALTLACDTSPTGLATIYPCDGTVIGVASRPEEFHWNGDLAAKWQVQFSSDPSFSTIAVSSKTSSTAFLKVKLWKPANDKWKKIRNLGADGATVYWRVFQRSRDDQGAVVETASNPVSFTVR